LQDRWQRCEGHSVLETDGGREGAGSPIRSLTALLPWAVGIEEL